MKIIKNYNDAVTGSIEGIKLYHELVKSALKFEAPIIHYIDEKTPEFVIIDEDTFVCEAFKSEAGYYLVKKGVKVINDGVGHNLFCYEDDIALMASNGIIIFNDMKYMPEVQKYLLECGFINTEHLESEIDNINKKYGIKLEALKSKGLTDENLSEMKSKYQKDYELEILNAYEMFT